MKKIYLWLIILIILVSIGIFIFVKFSKTNSAITKSANPIIINLSPTISTTSQIFIEPVKNFKARVTKKPFGIYVTPKNSPVQPERFTGYHTGTDAEYQDITTDVPVVAIADGTIKLARTASGYGGVIIEETKIDNVAHSVLYGHIRPSSLPKIDQTVKAGQQIGLLGTGYSTETDGERRHLHLAILSNNRIDLLGYVQQKAELSNWIDPLKFF